VAFSAFLDADVLFPVGLRDSLLWIAHFEVNSPRWSADVLKEMRKNILEQHKHVAEKDLDEMVQDMQVAFPEAEVTGYQKLIDVMPVNEKDRHVLAAAVVAKVGVLVTNDFLDHLEKTAPNFAKEARSAWEIKP
jgi:predicted nucleic acid-binding protein